MSNCFDKISRLNRRLFVYALIVRLSFFLILAADVCMVLTHCQGLFSSFNVYSFSSHYGNMNLIFIREYVAIFTDYKNSTFFNLKPIDIIDILSENLMMQALGYIIKNSLAITSWLILVCYWYFEKLMAIEIEKKYFKWMSYQVLLNYAKNHLNNSNKIRKV